MNVNKTLFNIILPKSFLMILLIAMSCWSFAEDMEDGGALENENVIEVESEAAEASESVNEQEVQEPEVVEEHEEEQDDDEGAYEAEESPVENSHTNTEDAGYKNTYQDINASDNSKFKANNKALNKTNINQTPSTAQESKILISKKKLDEKDEKFECDPMVSIQVKNKLRFDILKQLADEHNFEIAMLESENKMMSLEKNLPLSKVVESITRDMSVVLNFRNEQGCKVLASIAVLDNSAWSGDGSSYRSSNDSKSENTEKLQRYRPKFEAPRIVPQDELVPIAPEVAEEQKTRQEERRTKRLEKKNMRSLNDEIQGGGRLNAQYNIRGDNWKKDKVDEADIPDMNQYVQEVMDGERQPDMRSMSTRQRSEYMQIRRELRAQQKQ